MMRGGSTSGFQRNFGRFADAGKRSRYTLIDLFAGAGGFTLGFVQSGGFRPVFSNDFNRWACETYDANFGSHCIPGDIQEILGEPAHLPRADVVIGGPPCQGFSLLNKKKADDPRKQLWRSYMRVVQLLRPRVFVMENVPEILHSLEFLKVRRLSEKLGYRLVAGILNAADYGVPQRRRRAVIIASRDGEPVLPTPTHAAPDLTGGRFRPWKTVRDAIGDLPRPRGTDIRVGRIEPPLDLHFGRTPTRRSIDRYRCVPEGGNRVDLQRERPDLTPRCWIDKRGGTDLLGRLWWDRPAFTIRTEFFKPEKGRYLHPRQHRPITHREAARLMSFPDDFVFQGTKIEVAKQIGNAVPPLLARCVAEAVLSVLESAAPVASRATGT